MKILILLFLIIPFIAGLCSFVLRNKRAAEALTFISSIISLIISFVFLIRLISGEAISIFNNTIVIDKFSAYIVLLVALVYFLSSMYSISYMRFAVKNEGLTDNEFFRYYLLINLFALTMLVAPILNNMALYLIDIELTTVTSSFLVITEITEKSIEAAWKYIVIVSSGISIALLGTILFYLAGNIHGIHRGIYGIISSLDWTVLSAHAAYLNKDLVKIAFILIVIGLGTKVGLAPMHTWLPDAHSEAPSPISTMLSASLLNTAMYGIMRYFNIAGKDLGFNYPQEIMIIIGLFTIFIGVMGIINQKTTKRLFAYSSIEHMGIISLGFGLGGIFGTFGALFQMLAHSLSKPIMFYGSGNLLQKYKTKNIQAIKGVIYTMPKTAFLYVAGALTLVGAPPSAAFIGEFLILLESFKKSDYFISVILIILLISAFIAILAKINSMIFGVSNDESIYDANNLKITKGDFGITSLMPMAIPLILTIFLGLYIPSPLKLFLNGIVRIIIK
ncbi:MAG: proton-conducting transporter transmembrane domain-containing protein [bacterium]